MKPEPDEQYRCDECGQVHDEAREAVACCAPSITEGWGCPVCRAFHESFEEAQDCCPPPGVKPAPVLTAWELEQAGQLRLFS